MPAADASMHRRLINLASGDGASFSIVVAVGDLADAVTLADAQGWSFVKSDPHARGVLLHFARPALGRSGDLGR